MHSLWHSHSLTGEWSDDDDRGAELYLEWSDRFPATASHYRDLLRQNTPSAKFWAEFRFCSEVVAALSVRRNDADRKRMIQTEVADFEETLPAAYIAVDLPASVTIFDHLMQIGVRVVPDAIAWAKEQMEGMVQRHRGVVHDCWALERVDEADTLQALSEYEGLLKERIEEAADVAYLEAAKRGKPAGKIIEAVIERSTPQLREDRADLDQKAAIEWAKTTKAKTVRNVRAAIIFKYDERTIRNWIDEGKLESAGRGQVTIQSVRLLMTEHHL